MCDGVSQKEEEKMKKFLLFLCAMFICAVHASTVDIDWMVDGTTYDQTTCQTGGDFILPAPAPTKYGYHFVGWEYDVIYGTGSQSGTPTLTNPIEPTFMSFGNTVLRAIGTGNDTIADSYDPITGKITRRVGVFVLNRTSDFSAYGDGILFGQSKMPAPMLRGNRQPGYCTHAPRTARQHGVIFGINNTTIYWTDLYTDLGITVNDMATLKAWFGDQYDAGTPVTLYYPLATPVEENFVQ